MDMQNPTWLRRWMDGELLTRWKQFFKELSHGHVLTFPRCYFATIKIDTANYRMRLFDASTAAYAAALYLKNKINGFISLNFVVSKSNIAPLNSLTIPRLELLLALLLTHPGSYSGHKSFSENLAV